MMPFSSNRDGLNSALRRNEQFHIACGPKRLSEAVEIFIHWFE